MNSVATLWSRLFQMADEIRDLAPWKQYYEAELFAIQPRSDGPVYFVSIMGNCGEHHAIAYYPGAESLHKFRLTQTMEDDYQQGMEMVLLNGHLQLAFEAKRDLDKAELEVLKALGKTYHGKWPVFRSYQSARLPGMPNLGELEDFLGLLEQTLVVLKRQEAGEDILRPFAQDEFFLRQKAGEWKDATCRVADLLLPHHCLSVDLPDGALDGLRRVNAHFEMDMFLMPSPVADVPPGEPPYFPFLLIAVDAGSGMVHGIELISTKEGVDEALAKIPETITKILRLAKVVPVKIAARHPILCSALEAYGNAYGIKFEAKEKLLAAEMAITHAMSFMGG